MKNKCLSITVLLLCILLFSCKKNDDNVITTIPTITYQNFSKLDSGNYWIYEEFDVDSNGNATSKNIFDSCWVEKDTSFNGKTYKKTWITNPYNPSLFDISYLRDSLHYIVNANGNILFSSMDFTGILKIHYNMATVTDTLCKMIKQMTAKNQSFTCPAGIFITSDARETYYMYPSFTFAGNKRYRHFRYAENIGLVSETLYFSLFDPNYVERRLVRYHLN
jgi:hypothetical protein